MFFNFGDNIGRFFFTKISEELFISPKLVGGNLLYSGDEQSVFFSVIKSVIKSSLNSVQSYRNKKIRVKNVTEFSEKKCDSPRRATKRALNSVTKKEIHRIQ